MEKGFLPYSDGFGNFWGSERDEYRNATAPQVSVSTSAAGGSATTSQNQSASINVYPKKIRGFFTNSSGSMKTTTQIFYEYNGFLPSANKTNSRCETNYANFLLIQQDISSITQDPFGMVSRLIAVRNLMNDFYMACIALNAPATSGSTAPFPSAPASPAPSAPVPSFPSAPASPAPSAPAPSAPAPSAPVPPLPSAPASPAPSAPAPSAPVSSQNTGFTTTYIPPIAQNQNFQLSPPISMGGGGMPVSGGSPLLEGDLSLYCSQVPDDPACGRSVESQNGEGMGKTNWLLIAGVGLAAYLGYRYFVKKK